MSWCPRKLRNKYYHQCWKKLRHENSLTALHHAASLRSFQPSDSFNVYACDFCAGLHVGHGNKALPEQDLILVSSHEAFSKEANDASCTL